MQYNTKLIYYNYNEDLQVILIAFLFVCKS